MSKSRNILSVEDSPSVARTYQGQLLALGHKVVIAGTGREARDAYNDADCVLLDLGLPDENGMDILLDWKATNKEKPVIVITGNGSMSLAIKAMHAGAEDFLVKPFPGERLRTTLENTLEKYFLTKTVNTYKKITDRDAFHGITGASLEMQAVYRTLESAARSRATVLITGESGTGKELAARAVHEISDRAGKPYIALNCGAIPKDLIESEIFGHVKGAFTGATNDRDGAASLANGGTLFLDEIGELDIGLQSKLLRFLQLGTFQKVGGSKTIKADIRFIAATNRNPIEAVEMGLLREDLYYRLNVLPIELPPLKARGGDVVLIANSFLSRFAAEEEREFTSFSPEALDLLKTHNWPGNVRELENVIRQIIVLNEGPIVEDYMVNTAVFGTLGKFSHQPAATSSEVVQTSRPQAEPTAPKPLWMAELDYIDAAIEYCDGNVQQAARLLEINPSTIYRKKTRAEARVSR